MEISKGGIMYLHRTTIFCEWSSYYFLIVREFYFLRMIHSKKMKSKETTFQMKFRIIEKFQSNCDHFVFWCCMSVYLNFRHIGWYQKPETVFAFWLASHSRKPNGIWWWRFQSWGCVDGYFHDLWWKRQVWRKRAMTEYHHFRTANIGLKINVNVKWKHEQQFRSSSWTDI